MAHTDGQEVSSTDLRCGSVLKDGRDVVPMTYNEFLHSRFTFAQPVGPDISFENFGTKMANLKRTQRQCTTAEIVDRIARTNFSSSISQLLVELFDESRFGSVQPVVDCHAIELSFEVIECSKHFVDAIVEASYPELIYQVAYYGHVSFKDVP